MSAETGAALQIDALKLIRSKETVSGSFAPQEMPRLADYLYSITGGVDYRIEGGYDARQRPLIHCIISGYLELACQRCLGPIEFKVGTDQQFIVVPREAAMPAPEEEEDDVDFIVAAPKFDVLALVEDEIILSLPLAPRHAEGACLPGGGVAI